MPGQTMGMYSLSDISYKVHLGYHYLLDDLTGQLDANVAGGVTRICLENKTVCIFWVVFLFMTGRLIVGLLLTGFRWPLSSFGPAPPRQIYTNIFMSNVPGGFFDPFRESHAWKKLNHPKKTDSHHAVVEGSSPIFFQLMKWSHLHHKTKNRFFEG